MGYTRDFWNISNDEFECSIRNNRSRISLIKQVKVKLMATVIRNGLRPLIAQSLTCDRSLIYGDIGFGDDELNWICKVRIEND